MAIAASLTTSATLATNERLRRLIAEGKPILHLASGEAGLPVPEEVIAALARGGSDNSYAPVAGSPAARVAAAGWFGRRRLPTEPDQIVIAPGSKALLRALLSILPGDVVLPRPSWVSYAAQAAIAGKRVWSVPIAPNGPGGVPDPDALEQTLADAAARGGEPGVLVLTLPDNPTGTVASADDVERLIEIAEAHGLSVVSDEIYRDLAHTPEQVRSPAEYLPETTYVTNGLSKNMAHRAATLAVHDRLTSAGVSCRRPTGGFHLYPDFGPLRQALLEHGAEDPMALPWIRESLDRLDAAFAGLSS
jgi:aspartate aminotransferase